MLDLSGRVGSIGLMLMLSAMIIKVAIVAGVVAIIAWNHVGHEVAIVAAGLTAVSTAVALFLLNRRRARWDAD